MGDEQIATQDVVRTLELLAGSLRNGNGGNGNVLNKSSPLLDDLKTIQKYLNAHLPSDDTAVVGDHHQQQHKHDRDTFQVPNGEIARQFALGRPDFLYHIGMVVQPDRAGEAFGDVEYVCVGGTPSRMQEFAGMALEVLQLSIPCGTGITDLCGGHARYVMYKAGPVLTVSHGMGNPSISIMIHEVLKLLHYARAKKPVTMIRLGTCGGIGVEPGTTVITNQVFNGRLKNYYKQYVLGEPVQYPAILDADLCEQLTSHARRPELNIPVVVGNTLCANDFYEEQGRLDGAFCRFSHEERMAFLQKCKEDYGIRNLEMESLAFSAMTHRAGIRAGVVCVALLNRLVSDKVSPAVEAHLEEWQKRPQRLIAQLIRHEIDLARARDGHELLLSKGQGHATDTISISNQSPSPSHSHTANISHSLLLPQISTEEFDSAHHSPAESPSRAESPVTDREHVQVVK